MLSLVVGFVAAFFLRANGLPLENEVPELSWKLYMYILQPKLQIMVCCNVRLMHYPWYPHSQPTPHAKKYNSKVE